ncbi:hypothetical protein BDW_06750 [Bdellovibrio bacteriovorus W]|nr:hypothetical protein BDW_06750 [Bdellovibrio bacteriovorus W]
MSNTHNNPSVDVLVGSPETSFLDTVAGILDGFYPYKLHHASAIDQVLEAEYTPKLAILDGRKGNTIANEWTQSTKMTFPDCKVIVLHTSEMGIDFKLIKKNGADEVMHLHFDREFLSDMVLDLAPVDISGDHIPITALMPVDLRDMEPEMDINFDIYVHLPANRKTVLLRRAGDRVEQKHIDKFKSLSQQMYIKKTQRKEFFEYARTVMSFRNSSIPVSMTEKFHRSKKTIYHFMSRFLNGGTTDFTEGREILESCKNIIQDLDLLKENSATEAFQEIFRYSGNTRTLYHDCICMAAYGAFFAQVLGWPLEKREDAAIAGLLHNIGLSQLPSSVFTEPELTPEDDMQFRLYPDRSVNMIKTKKVPISAAVADAIAQHREKSNGKGFPRFLTNDGISDLGKLLIYSFSFLQLTSLDDDIKGKTPMDAIETLKDDVISGKNETDLLISTGIAKKAASLSL